MSDYLDAKRVCDLVMKGGITSGIVYPPAILRIARRFWLCGIGGTSAGAIAAALAAAAEYRRRNASGVGFEELGRLPEQIAGPGRLLALFKPDGGTRPLFSLFLRGLRSKDKSWLAKGGLALSAAGLLARGALRSFTDNGLGLCTGLALGNRSGSDPLPPLTQWLSDRLDSIATMPAGRPLTFGDLWSAPKPPCCTGAATNEKSIQLQLISTCLTFGRPYALPHLDRRFAFSPSDFKRLFPAHVVQYMVTAAKQIGVKDPLPEGLLPLPSGASLPVIVAVRMSLSFPALFSMVRLYYPSYRDGRKEMQEVYFSDGGISSNLPIHFFDSPFPRWPTLAINLQYTGRAGESGRSGAGPDGVYMPPDKRSPPWLVTGTTSGSTLAPIRTATSLTRRGSSVCGSGPTASRTRATSTPTGRLIC